MTQFQLERLPAVVAGATEAAISEWTMKVGDSIIDGDVIAVVETDKVTVDLATHSEGVIVRTLVDEGELVAVGEPIAVISTQVGWDAEALSQYLHAAGLSVGSEAPASVTSEPSASVASEAPHEEQAAPSPQGEPTRTFATPLVRRLAGEQRVDLRQISGTGPNGRITKSDLLKHGTSRIPVGSSSAGGDESAPPPSSVSAAGIVIELTANRRGIVNVVTTSHREIPVFSIRSSVRIDAAGDLLTQLREQAPHRKVGLTSILLKAMANAFVENPQSNAVWAVDKIRMFEDVSIAVAIGTETSLYMPTLEKVQNLSLTGIVGGVDELRADPARQTKPGAGALSNLGQYDVEEFTAIINPGNSMVLAVGTAHELVRSVDGQFVAVKQIVCTASFDHRVVDGVLAARWMASFRASMENPLLTLVDGI